MSPPTQLFCYRFFCFCFVFALFFFLFFFFFFFGGGGGGGGGERERERYFSEFIWNYKSIAPIFATGTLVLALHTDHSPQLQKHVYFWSGFTTGALKRNHQVKKSAFKGELVGATIASALGSALYFSRII